MRAKKELIFASLYGEAVSNETASQPLKTYHAFMVSKRDWKVAEEHSILSATTYENCWQQFRSGLVWE